MLNTVNTKTLLALKNKQASVKRSLLYFLCYLIIAILAILFFLLGSYYDFENDCFTVQNSYQNIIIQFEMAISGIGLGMVGAALQATTRNDLSGPTTLGFVPAIILGIYIPIIFAGEVVSNFFNKTGALFLFGILFGLILLFVNFFLTRGRKKNLKNNYVPLLVGFSIGILMSVICVILTNYYIPIQNSGYNMFGVWAGVEHINSDLINLEYGAPLILISSIIIYFLSRYLNIVEKDPSLAKSMGINIDLIYWVVGVLAVIIVASSILMVGSILLLAIVAPHLARKLFKTSNYFVILPFTAILCMTLLNLSYVVTQADTDIGINLVPILFCAPIFVVLLKRK